MTPQTQKPAYTPTPVDKARLVAALPEPARAGIAPELAALDTAYDLYESAVADVQAAAVRELAKAAGFDPTTMPGFATPTGPGGPLEGVAPRAAAKILQASADAAAALADVVEADAARPLPPTAKPPAKAAAPRRTPTKSVQAGQLGLPELRVYDAVRQAPAGLTRDELVAVVYPPGPGSEPPSTGNRVPRAVRVLEGLGLVTRGGGRVRARLPAPVIEYGDMATVAGVYCHLRSTTRAVPLGDLHAWYNRVYGGNARAGSRAYANGRANLGNVLRYSLAAAGLVRYDEFAEGWAAPAAGDKAIRKLPPVREPQAAAEAARD